MNYLDAVYYAKGIGRRKEETKPEEEKETSLLDDAIELGKLGLTQGMMFPNFLGGLATETAGNVLQGLGNLQRNSLAGQYAPEVADLLQSLGEGATGVAETMANTGTLVPRISYNPDPTEDTPSKFINQTNSAYTGALGNVARFLHADKVADAYGNKANELRVKDEERPAPDFTLDYLLSGLPVDFGELTGSMAAIAPAMAALPESAVAGMLNPIARAMINRGMYGAAKVFSQLAPNAVRYGLTSAPLEGIMEGGMTRENLLAQGYSDEEATKQSAITAAKNMALLLPTNTLEGLAVLSPLARAGKLATAGQIGGRGLLNTAQESYEEFAQEGIQNAAEGKPYSYNPFNGADNQYEAAKHVAGPAALMGLIGGGVGAYRGRNTTDEQRENQQNWNRGSQENISNDDYAKRANLTSKQAEIWDAAQYAAARAKEKYGYDIQPELIYKQWAHEAGANFDSENARYNNNFGGLTQTEPNGEENKQPDGDNYYRHFNNVREYADAYVDDFIKYYPEISGAKNEREFANVLKKYGYFGDSVENYASSMEGIAAPSSRTDFAKNYESIHYLGDNGKGEGNTWQKQNDNVSLDRAQPDLLNAIDILGKWFYDRTGKRLIVTSGDDGDHTKSEHDHYNGWKVDVNDWDGESDGYLVTADGSKGSLTDEFIKFGQSIGLGMNWEGDHIDVALDGNQWADENGNALDTPQNFGGFNPRKTANNQSSIQPSQQQQQPTTPKPLFDINREDDQAQDIFAQFAEEKYLNGLEKNNNDEVDFFSGMFDTDGKFQSTKENRDAIRQNFTDEFTAFAQNAMPKEQPTAQPKQAQSQQIQQTQPENPLLVNDNLRDVMINYLDSIDRNAPENSGFALEIEKAFNDGKQEKVKSMLESRGVSTTSQADPVTQNKPPENILPTPKKLSGQEKMIRDASAPVIEGKKGNKKRITQGKALIKLAVQNKVEIPAIEVLALQNGSTIVVQKWHDELSKRGLFNTSQPQAQAQQVEPQRQDNSAAILKAREAYDNRKNKAMAVARNLMNMSETDESFVKHKSPNQSRTQSEPWEDLSEWSREHDITGTAYEKELQQRQAEEERYHQWKAKQDRELEELKARQAENKRLAEVRRKMDEEKVARQAAEEKQQQIGNIQSILGNQDTELQRQITFALSEPSANKQNREKQESKLWRQGDLDYTFELAGRDEDRRAAKERADNQAQDRRQRELWETELADEEEEVVGNLDYARDQRYLEEEEDENTEWVQQERQRTQNLFGTPKPAKSETEEGNRNVSSLPPESPQPIEQSQSQSPKPETTEIKSESKTTSTALFKRNDEDFPDIPAGRKAIKNAPDGTKIHGKWVGFGENSESQYIIQNGKLQRLGENGYRDGKAVKLSPENIRKHFGQHSLSELELIYPENKPQTEQSQPANQTEPKKAAKGKWYTIGSAGSREDLQRLIREKFFGAPLTIQDDGSVVHEETGEILSGIVRNNKGRWQYGKYEDNVEAEPKAESEQETEPKVQDNSRKEYDKQLDDESEQFFLKHAGIDMQDNKIFSAAIKSNAFPHSNEVKFSKSIQDRLNEIAKFYDGQSKASARPMGSIAGYAFKTPEARDQFIRSVMSEGILETEQGRQASVAKEREKIEAKEKADEAERNAKIEKVLGDAKEEAYKILEADKYPEVKNFIDRQVEKGIRGRNPRIIADFEKIAEDLVKATKSYKDAGHLPNGVLYEVLNGWRKDRYTGRARRLSTRDREKESVATEIIKQAERDEVSLEDAYEDMKHYLKTGRRKSKKTTSEPLAENNPQSEKQLPKTAEEKYSEQGKGIGTENEETFERKLTKSIRQMFGETQSAKAEKFLSNARKEAYRIFEADKYPEVKLFVDDEIRRECYNGNEVEFDNLKKNIEEFLESLRKGKKNNFQETIQKIKEIYGEPKRSQQGSEVDTEIRNYVDQKDLTPQQQLLQDFGRKLGTRVIFFNNGDGRFHGQHSNGITYLNVVSNMPLGKVFWHESMHWLKANNPKLYQQLVKAAGITDEQRQAYLERTERNDLKNDEAIDEEIIADQFEDVAKRSGLLQSIAGKNRGLIQRVIQWLQDTMKKFIEHFRNPQGKLTTAQSQALADEFGKIAKDLVDPNGEQIFRYNRQTHNVELANGRDWDSSTEHSDNLGALNLQPKYSIDASDNSNESTLQRIRNKVSAFFNPPPKSRNKRIKQFLEKLADIRIVAGHIKGAKAIDVDEFHRLLHTRKAYDWENILPEIGGMLAKSLNIQDSEAMRNYVTDWLLTGAPNNNSAEAKIFQQAARNNPAMFEILQKIRDEFDEFNNLEPEERYAEGITDGEKTLGEKLGYYKDNWREEFTDDLHPIERMFNQVVAKAEKTNPKLAEWLKESVNPYELARLVRGKGAVADILVGKVKTSPSKKINEIRTKLAEAYPNVNLSNFKPITMILEEIGALKDKKRQRLFEAFCVAKLDKEMYEKMRSDPKTYKDITPFRSESDADATIAKYEKEFGQAQRDLVHYSNILITMRYDAGLMSKSKYDDILNGWKNYIPTARVFEENEDYDFIDSLKQKTGSHRDIRTPIQKLIDNTNSLVKQAERNKVKCQVAQLARCGQFGQIIAVTENSKPNLDNTVLFYEHGKKCWLETPDLSVVRALNSIQSQKDGAWIVKAFNAVMSWFKGFQTFWNPDFSAGNIFRDSAAAYIHNKHLGYANPFMFFADVARIGLKGFWTKDSNWLEWQMFGGSQASFVSQDVDYVQRSISDITETSWESVKKHPLSYILDKMQYVAEASETATRLTTYVRTRDALAKQRADGKATIDDKRRAALTSRNATIDFSRAGTSTRKANRVFAFANAAVQDWALQAQTFSPAQIQKAINGNKQAQQQIFSAAFRLVLMGIVPTLLQFALMHRDDEKKKIYSDLHDWEKETYWYFGDLVHIPKSMDIGIRLTSAITDEFLKTAIDKEPAEWKRFRRLILDAAPGLTATLATPAVEAWVNYSIFRDAPIVPGKEQHLPGNLQYGHDTSPAAKFISDNTLTIAKIFGAETGFSPRKIDYMISGYLGFMGRFFSHLPNYVGRGSISRDELPIVRRFLYEPYKNPKIVKDYYEALDEQASLYNGYKLELQKDRKTKPPKDFDPKLYGRLKSAQKTMQNLSKREKQIEEDPKLSESQRKEKLRELELRRIEICERVFNKAR